MAGSRLHRRLVEWLGAFRVRHARGCLLSGIGVALLAAIVWVATFWVIKFVLWWAFSWLLSTPFHRSVAAVGVCGLLFVVHRRVFAELAAEQGADHPALANSFRSGAWILGDSLSVLAGPKSLAAPVKVVLTVILMAPRLTQLAIELFTRSRTAAGMDMESAADVLAVLLKSDRKIPLDELIQNAPQLEWRRVLREITLIDGVLIRIGEDPLVSLADSSRLEITDQLEKMAGG